MKAKENKKMSVSAVAHTWFDMFEIEDDCLPDFGTCSSVESALNAIRDFMISNGKSEETNN